MNNNYIDPLELRDINFYSSRKQTKLDVTSVRLNLYNNGHKYGQEAIQNEMQRLEIPSIPSTAAIGRILRDQYLTDGGTGYYPGDFP